MFVSDEVKEARKVARELQKKKSQIEMAEKSGVIHAEEGQAKYGLDESEVKSDT